MSRRSEATLNRVAEEWKNLLVAGWFAGEVPWFYYPERIAAMEEELVGAKEKELIIRADTIYDITLEQSTIENKSHFFEEIYGFKPVLRMKRR